MKGNLKMQIGMIGLGVMGQNLAINISEKGYTVAAYDLSETQRHMVKDTFAEKNIHLCDDLDRLVSVLEHPRKIMIMVPAGRPVDDVINTLKPLLAAGDILIDGGNSYFMNTTSRMHELKKSGILFIGAGVSGGAEGARKGPSLMPGGNSEGWPHIRELLQNIAARVDDGEPCCDWVGEEGAGHFVKMIHNGIEYGDMQMISEAYFLLEQLMGLDPEEMADIFASWNKGELNSYLIDITARILRKKDEATGKPIIHIILDTVGQKGTGKWTSQTALDLGVPAQTIAKAVFARIASSYREERVYASKILKGPLPHFHTADKAGFIDYIRKALYASKICSYAQGFQLMKRAAEEYKWQLDFSKIASLWRAGCIIRADFLNHIRTAYEKNPDLQNLLLDPYFVKAIDASQVAWRKIIAIAVENGIPIPGFSSALSYYDTYRAEILPARLVQAQRDFFGAHTYERIDKPRGQFFHTNWED